MFASVDECAVRVTENHASTYAFLFTELRTIRGTPLSQEQQLRRHLYSIFMSDKCVNDDQLTAIFLVTIRIAPLITL